MWKKRNHSDADAEGSNGYKLMVKDKKKQIAWGWVPFIFYHQFITSPNTY